MEEMKRKPISKSVRFEVFKRDAFKCQYCGASAPDVILNVDHITPVAGGGDNHITNLVTACAGCNGGKSDKPLSDQSSTKMAMAQLQEIQERREQLDMIAQWRKELLALDVDSATAAASYFSSLADVKVNNDGVSQLKLLIRRFSLAEVMEAIDVAVKSYIKHGTYQEKVNAFGKVGGICVMSRREKEDPALAKRLHIQNILAKKTDYLSDRDINLLKVIFECGGLSPKTLEDLARSAKDFEDFESLVEDARMENFKADSNP